MASPPSGMSVVAAGDSPRTSRTVLNPGDSLAPDKGTPCWDNKDPNIPINVSLFVNICLFMIKLLVSILSGSLAVIASLTDSATDLLGQMVIYVAQKRGAIERPDKFPAGRARLEPLSVIVFATLMITLSIFIIREAIEDAATGIANKGKIVRLTFDLIFPMVGVIVVKGLLWLYCRRFTDAKNVMVLAQDHINDVLSNFIALLAAALASFIPSVWYLDPIGAFLVSCFIIKTWWDEMQDNMKLLVGRAAKEEKMDVIGQTISGVVAQKTEIGNIVAFHVGEQLSVEATLVMNEHDEMKTAADLCLEVKEALEELDEVERAFVFADYARVDV